MGRVSKFPREIRVQSKGMDPFSLRVTDPEGNPIDGVRSITWRVRRPGIPTFVIEGDGLDLDVTGELRASDAEVKLEQIHTSIKQRIESTREWLAFCEKEPDRVGPGSAHHARVAIRTDEEFLEEFFGG